MKKEINCTTDLCVNLKTILRSDKRAKSGKSYLGILRRDEASEEFNFDERKLDPRVMRWCRLTSWRDKQGISWLQTPYYNREGQLVGIQNRNLGKSPSGDLGGPPHPRFRFPAGSQCGIYNLPVLNLLKPGDELYITEGCSDC